MVDLAKLKEQLKAQTDPNDQRMATGYYVAAVVLPLIGAIEDLQKQVTDARTKIAQLEKNQPRFT